MKPMNLNRLAFPILLTIVFLPVLTNGAPIPGTSSSLLIDSENGTFRSALGFQVSAGQSDWILTEAPRNHKYIAVQYKAPDTDTGIQAALTVRVDRLKKRTGLKKYVKRWIRDYPKLGFDILAARKIKIHKKPAFLIDLINRESQLQLRQVVFLKQKKAVILTCRDNKERFLQNLKSCNNIFRSFVWTLPEKKVEKSKLASAKTSSRKRKTTRK